ncbi:hypothetical protein P1J78_19645 [Psychromarinibacter sp. C21-152]|uniref:Uncharacterized protein n=1 Tax=Psychromarinibacter sediminicola TaxID=3033385 RepID=A0AAE3TAK9_9RHOB|nr:hypothetical protein [Psychromarinibacter sediminicola]MDF0602963.1 hypothetical protein [Psychromarinibacter sediminicola]
MAGALVLPAACDSPSPAFSRLPAHRVTVDDATFSVRFTPFEAEALRVSRGLPGSRGEVMFAGARAIMLASGCPVVPKTLEGDPAIVRASLDCAGTGPRPSPPAAPEAYDCGFVGPWRKDGIPWKSATIDCVRVE